MSPPALAGGAQRRGPDPHEQPGAPLPTPAARYPAPYRRRRGDELLATLLEAAAPGQHYPTLCETLGLLGGGLSARTGVAGGCTPWGLWAEGLRLGALLLLVSLTGDAASATWLQTNHLVFTWIFSNAAGWR